MLFFPPKFIGYKIVFLLFFSCVRAVIAFIVTVAKVFTLIRSRYEAASQRNTMVEFALVFNFGCNSVTQYTK